MRTSTIFCFLFLQTMAATAFADTPEQDAAVDRFFGRMTCDTRARLICDPNLCRKLSSKETGPGSPEDTNRDGVLSYELTPGSSGRFLDVLTCRSAS